MQAAVTPLIGMFRDLLANEVDFRAEEAIFQGKRPISAQGLEPRMTSDRKLQHLNDL